jgi:hypothetical protein
MKKIYIGECEHLENCCITDDECLKRHIHVINPRTNEVECLIFCNDYLKLNAQREQKYNFSTKEAVLDFIEKKILEHLSIKEDKTTRFGCSNTLTGYRFPFYISQKPFVYCYLSIKDLLEFYNENPNYHMTNMLVEELGKFLRGLNYMKYKTKYNQLIVLSNKLKKYNIPKEEKESIIIELINETFKLTIKNQ